MIRILLYKGKSITSRLIEWQTRSPYSHAAIQLSDGRVVEAVGKYGVHVIDDPRFGHAPGTEIDAYIYHQAVSAAAEYAAAKWLYQQLGKQYDYRSVFRFMSRVPASENDRWFCSELVAEFCDRLYRPLFNSRALSHNVSPRDVSMSAELVFWGSQ